MFQKFLVKSSKKNKVIIFLFVGSIFLVFFTLSQGDKKQYYQKKIENLRQLKQDNQFKKEVLDRYQSDLTAGAEKEEKKWVLDVPLEKTNEKLLKIMQNSKIRILDEKDIFEEYGDFSLGQKQIQFLASYKNLNQFITDLKKENVWISAIKINNSSIYSLNPQLNIMLSIHYIFRDF